MSKKHNRFIKSAIFSIFFSAILVFTTNALSLQNEFHSYLYENMVRLHILANSNTAVDQNAKIEIRDEILPYLSKITRNAQNANQAEKVLKENISKINSKIEEAVFDLGYEYSVKTEISKEFYPVRNYGLFSFPSGDYISFRIILGDGKGKNWWCVIYPSVCTSLFENEIQNYDFRSALTSAGISKNIVDEICSQKLTTKLSFYFLELLEKIKRK